MDESDGRDDFGVITAFLGMYLADATRGSAQPVEAYRARFPGFEELIEAEYGRLQQEQEQKQEQEGDEEEPAPGPGTHGDAVGGADGGVDGGVDGGADGGRVARYRIDGEIARGGMGRILAVWDAKFDRPLAMKTTRTDLCKGEVEARARLLEEARVTGQLHHPGIVPVHDLGRDDRRRPFFTMDLVRGRSFAEVITAARAGRDGWNVTRALGVLQRACEAVGYAHSKGVVHRDLKPDNVMVGRFGEVYVMDWGLARVVGRPDRPATAAAPDDEAAQSLVLPRAGSDSPAFTLQGDVVGTPAYMAPEQARGDLAAVGPHTDVYAVGGMLYQLLTGCMPYVASGEHASSRVVLERVTSGPPTPVASLARTAPPELVAICEKAMARRPEDRYAEVQALGEDLRAFLESRVVRAYATGALAELRKWIARNRALAIAGAAAVLALAGGLVLTLVQKSRADAEATRADQQAARAEASFGDAMDAVDRMLTRVGQDSLQNVPQADAVRRELLVDALAFYERFLAARGDDPKVQERAANAAYRVGSIQSRLGNIEAAEAASRRSIALCERMIADGAGDQARLDLSMACDQLAIDLMNHGRFDEAEALFQRALELAEVLCETHADSQDHLMKRASCVTSFAVLRARTKELDRAAELARRAVELWTELVERFGDGYLAQAAKARDTLGGVLWSKSDQAGAEREWQTAVTEYERLLADGGDDARLLNNAGGAIANLAMAETERDPEAGEVTGRRALQIRRRLVESYPTVPSYRADLGSSLSNLAGTVRRRGRLEDALPLVEEALEQHRAAVAGDPGNPVRIHSLGLAYRTAHRILHPLGMHHRGAENADRLVVESGSHPGWTVEAAANLTGYVALAAKDPELAPDERTALTERYGRRAVELLRGVFENHGLEPKQLEHRYFAALRQRDDFQRLVADVAADADAAAGRRAAHK